MLYLHMHLTQIIRPLTDSLYRQLFQLHLTMYYLLQSLYTCINRAVTCCGSLKNLIGNLQLNGSNRRNTFTRCNLQRLHLNQMLRSVYCCSSEH